MGHKSQKERNSSTTQKKTIKPQKENGKRKKKDLKINRETLFKMAVSLYI